MTDRIHRFTVGIPQRTKLLRLDRFNDGWCLWIHHNPSLTEGTYLMLYNDGKCERIILNRDGTEEHFVVVP